MLFLVILPVGKKCPVRHFLSDTLAEWEILTPLPAILELRNHNFF